MEAARRADLIGSGINTIEFLICRARDPYGTECDDHIRTGRGERNRRFLSAGFPGARLQSSLARPDDDLIFPFIDSKEASTAAGHSRCCSGDDLIGSWINFVDALTIDIWKPDSIFAHSHPGPGQQKTHMAGTLNADISDRIVSHMNAKQR